MELYYRDIFLMFLAISVALSALMLLIGFWEGNLAYKNAT